MYVHSGVFEEGGGAARDLERKNRHLTGCLWQTFCDPERVTLMGMCDLGASTRINKFPTFHLAQQDFLSSSKVVGVFKEQVISIHSILYQGL